LSTTIIPKLPDRFDPNRGEDIPSDLIGATIVGFGTTNEGIEGGGLVIDYMPAGSSCGKRLKLAFTELGMWSESNQAGGRE
jgi:hypothetical protein